MTPTLQLCVVRHGETSWSLTGQHTGRTDLPLTANGERMAGDLAHGLEGVRFSRVLTSPRLRARMTCQLAGLGGTAEVVPDLAEWDYGDYEGLRGSEVEGLRPGWNIWRDGCPGGESPLQVSQRADRFIAGLQTVGGRVAIFSHGQFGRALAARWIGLEISEGRHLLFGPARLGVLGHDGDHPGRRVISLWNATTGSLPGIAQA